MQSQSHSRGSFWRASAVLVCVACCSARGVAGEYPYLYRSAYFLGRGDTGIAIADDEEAIFYNPAGLALGTGIYKQTIFASPMLEVSRGTRDLAKQIGLQRSDPIDSFRKQQGNAQHVGFNQFTGVVLRRAALGAFAHGTTTAMLYKDYTKGALETISAQSINDVGLTFSLAQSFFSRNLYFGLTGKYFKRTQAGLEANATETNRLSDLSGDELTMLGTASGADLGLMYRSEGRAPFSFGLTVQDVGHTAFSPDTPTTLPKARRPLKDIKQTINAGVAFEPGTKFSKVRVLADIRDLANVTKEAVAKKIHIGGELTVNNFIGFTAGLNQGYGSFGFYIDSRFIRVDLGGYTEEIGEGAGSRPDQRYYFKFAIGL